ncbi:hypothetical protein KC974_01160 [Candidatus Saccharibacteria bacterium]|nr:hypothetical protein [Candidatus Saccharibacteria bacterium]
MSVQTDQYPKEAVELNPYLSDHEIEEQQRDLVREVFDRTQLETIHAVWMGPRSRYSNLVRTLETRQFPEMPDVMDGYEDDCKFLALLDTRSGIERVVHAFRLSVPTIDRAQGLQIALLDDLVKSNQKLTEDELQEFYAAQGIALNSEAASVESNFRVGDKVETDNGLRVSDLGYIAIFQHIAENGGAKVIFAHLNDAAVNSLGAIGVQDAPIAGVENLSTPTVIDGQAGFDEKYHPVAIMNTPQNLAVFAQLTPFAAPEVQL